MIVTLTYRNVSQVLRNPYNLLTDMRAESRNKPRLEAILALL